MKLMCPVPKCGGVVMASWGMHWYFCNYRPLDMVSLLGEGVKLGVSSRGMGSIDRRENANYVMDDFMLATAADIVADPSAPDAFVNGIMEGKEWVWDNGLLKEKTVSKYQGYISESSKKDLEERTLQVFEHFLSNL